MLKTTTSTQPHELHSGDHMSREEFHRLYEQMPEDFKAELIGGVVYVASPMRLPHGKWHLQMASLVGAYEAHTPGVEAGDNATLILAEDCEPQPDLFLRILPEFGGQSSTTEDEYLQGAPELVAEIAHASRAIDLHAKRDDYARYGVLEYLVLNLHDRRLHWFDLAANRELSSDDGVFRMQTMPGLWIHADAVFAKDYQTMMATLEDGLASEEHGAFVEELRERKGN